MNPLAQVRSEEEWYLAETAFDKGNHRQSLEHLFRYLGFPDCASAAEPSLDFELPHGSIRLRFRCDDQGWSISAPFVRLPEPSEPGPGDSLALALMRQVLEMNTGVLTLARIALRERDFVFEAGDSLANGHPRKLLALITEICTCADSHDDIFVEKFKAGALNPVDLDRFDPDQVSQAWELFHSLLAQAIEDATWFEIRREYGTSWDTLATGILRVQWILFPQGRVGIELKDCQELLYTDDPIETRITRGRARLKKFLEISEDQLRPYLFKPRFIVPLRPNVEIPGIQSQLGWHHETARGLISDRRYRTAALSMSYITCWLLASFSLPPDIQTQLEEALQRASGMDWKPACEVYYRALDGIMSRKLWAEGPPPTPGAVVAETNPSPYQEGRS